MLYKVPDEWTEESFLNLPDEDDRYEYKSGMLIDQAIADPKLEERLAEKLGKELGGLVNSFGGTLFLGAKDKSKEIDGCPAIFKGRETVKDWLEKKIPEWFDFRLYSFRINTVKLSDDTQDGIGVDRSLLHIDLWDSGHLPHQLKYDRHYYYRENSSSVVAPHYFLSFVANSRLPAMSEKVKLWCTQFLNPAIEFLKETEMSLRYTTFRPRHRKLANGASGTEIDLFDFGKWGEFAGGTVLAAKQFFYVYPDTKKRCESLWANGLELERKAKLLVDAVHGSPHLKSFCRNELQRLNKGVRDFELPDDSDDVMRLFGQALGFGINQLTDEQTAEETHHSMSRMIAWNLLELAISGWPWGQDSPFWELAQRAAPALNTDLPVREAKGAVESEMKRCSEECGELLGFLDVQRDEITATYATTYF